MWQLLLLANISRCATSALCPSDAELKAAVGAHDANFAQAVADQAAAGGEIVLVHSQRILGISSAICGEELTEQPQTITCSFTVRYWRDKAYQVAKLVKRADGWEIADSLGVTRRRR